MACWQQQQSRIASHVSMPTFLSIHTLPFYIWNALQKSLFVGFLDQLILCAPAGLTAVATAFCSYQELVIRHVLPASWPLLELTDGGCPQWL